jgi:hypothetical protein
MVIHPAIQPPPVVVPGCRFFKAWDQPLTLSTYQYGEHKQCENHLTILLFLYTQQYCTRVTTSPLCVTGVDLAPNKTWSAGGGCLLLLRYLHINPLAPPPTSRMRNNCSVYQLTRKYSLLGSFLMTSYSTVQSAPGVSLGMCLSWQQIATVTEIRTYY